MTLTIDAEFQALCPPLHPEEREQLEASLLAEGCREPLWVWMQQAEEVSCTSCEDEVRNHWEEGRWVCDTCGYGGDPEVYVLLDGHNRYALCLQHNIPFETHPIDLETREEAINWIIATQLGRRNLTEEQKSYLCGKRYNLDKQQRGGDQTFYHNDKMSGPTHERLATEYHVAPQTIVRDGQFATALDTLEAQVRQDIRETVSRRQDRDQGRITKERVTTTGKLVQTQTVTPQPFMRREGWKPYQVLEAIERLGALPADEHPALNTLLDQPFIPAADGLVMLKNLKEC